MRTLIVGIAGPPCAGKSTVCSILSSENKKIVHLNMENFYKSTELAPFYKGHRNLDSPRSINFESLEEALKQIKEGKEVTIPVYSKETSAQIGTEKIKSSEIVLVEGFLLFSRRKVRDMLDVLVFIDIDFDTLAERKRIRKMGSDLNLEYYNTVLVPMTKKYVIPSKRYADYVINGTKQIEAVRNEVINILNKEQVLY